MMKRIVVILFILLAVSGTVMAQGKGDSNPVGGGTAGSSRANIDVLQGMLAQGSTPVTIGELLIEQPFDAEDAWETYSDDQGGSLQLLNGQYLVTAGDANLIMWGQNQIPHRDVVIEADTTQLSPEANNGYGVMCRADPANTLDGYHFWISGDGYAAILISVDGTADYLVEWERKVDINPGQDLNRIAAVCAGDYLALYANGALLLETHDSTYTQGVAGMSAIGFTEGAATEIAFDHLLIWNIVTENRGATGPSGIRSLSSSEAALLPEVNNLLTQGTEPHTAQSLLLNEEFDADDAWEIYEDEVGSLQILSGQYIITQGENSIMWGQNRDIHTDVILQADTDQLSTQLNNGYGLMCRADPANTVDGYHFYISGDGYYAIFLFKNQDSKPLVDWTRSNTINLGQERNTLTVICAGNYLAFYANGTLLDEVSDTTYTSGAAGMAAVTFVEGDPVEVAFDNLRLWTVTP